jgi:hypothetical protein
VEQEVVLEGQLVECLEELVGLMVELAGVIRKN